MTMRKLCLLSLALGTSFVVTPARADRDDDPAVKHPSVTLTDTSEEPEPIVEPPPTKAKPAPAGTLSLRTPAREGEYQGVALGSDKLPLRPKSTPPKSGPPRVVWTGFQIKDGVPTLFVELTGQVPYRIEDTPTGLLLHLEGTKATLRNHLRPLRASFFETAITDVEPKQHGKSLVVAIKRRGKGALQHRERWETAPGGYQRLIVEFPQ